VKLNWQKKKLFFEYGYDESFRTGIIWNSVSLAISIKGCWIGI
jgi:hypothetical protein